MIQCIDSNTCGLPERAPLNLVVADEHEGTRDRARELRRPAAPQATDTVAVLERSVHVAERDMLAIGGDAGRVGDDKPAGDEAERVRDGAGEEGSRLRDGKLGREAHGAPVLFERVDLLERVKDAKVGRTVHDDAESREGERARHERTRA